MPTGDAANLKFTPEMYWRVRERELARKLQLVKDAIDECEQARNVLVNLSDTAKLNDPNWEDAQNAAMRSLRKARGAKTQLRNWVGHARDTIRIKPYLAEAVPQSVVDTLDTASRLCEYLDAHGF